MAKYFLAFVAFGALLTLCKADCFQEENDTENPRAACTDNDGEEHAPGSKWIKNCYECQCSNAGYMSCCRDYKNRDCWPDYMKNEA